MSTSKLILEARGLRKEYDSHEAVSGASCNLRQGEICAMIGRNGAGKSTILRMLAGIFRPDGGYLRIDPELKVGYLPEERGLYPDMKVLDHLQYMGQLRGQRSLFARTKSFELLQKVGLGEWATRKVKQLSKGMQQKVQILAIMIHDPDLLILDEPFSGLDPTNLKMMTDLFLAVRKQGTGILLTTHELSVAEKIADRACMLDAGKVLWQGDMNELQKQFGTNLYRFRFAPSINPLTSWPAELAKCVRAFRRIDGQLFELDFAPDISGESVAQSLLARQAIEGFEPYRPSLEEAFKRLTSTATVSRKN
jgi:ABC-2 type transport system ATP-binding protein